jgi:hypothetical protein
MGLQIGRAASGIVRAGVASLVGWIAVAGWAVAEETVPAAMQSGSEIDQSPSDPPLDPAVLLEARPSVATKKEVDEEVRELLRQTDQLDEESDKDLRGDAPLPAPPRLSR